MTNRIDDAVRTATATSIPSITSQESRPWPVVLLTALGAWLAALPLLGVVGLMLGDVISRGAGPYVVGALVLIGAVVVLRSATVPVFVEQLATPFLLVGAGALSFGLFRDLSVQVAAFVLLLVAAGLALIIPRAWLRVLLGAAAATLLMIVLVPQRAFNAGRMPVALFWLALHVVLAVWLAALAVQHRVLNSGARARMAAALESLASGWALALLAGLCWLAGTTFMVGGALGAGLAADVARELGNRQQPAWEATVLQAGSVLFALAAAGWAAWSWRSLRQPLLACAAAVLLAIAWFMPALGAVLLALAVAGTTRRWHLAGAAGLAMAWIIGGFYYQLQWPLAHKALVLVLAGAALGGLAWLAHRRQMVSAIMTGAAGDAPGIAAVAGNAPGWIALAAVATLAVANFSIWQKENIIAHGEPLFVELTPVDPRSLMQGDYMRLGFRMPDVLGKDLDNPVTRQRPHVIAKRDARGVATLLRMARNGDAPLQDGEFRIELTPKDGGWILVSDAWFFREGDAALWEKAKFGEFRVLPSGTALLVGMADAGLQPIGR